MGVERCLIEFHARFFKDGERASDGDDAFDFILPTHAHFTPTTLSDRGVDPILTAIKRNAFVASHECVGICYHFVHDDPTGYSVLEREINELGAINALDGHLTAILAELDEAKISWETGPRAGMTLAHIITLWECTYGYGRDTADGPGEFDVDYEMVGKRLDLKELAKWHRTRAD